MSRLDESIARVQKKLRMTCAAPLSEKATRINRIVELEIDDVQRILKSHKELQETIEKYHDVFC